MTTSPQLANPFPRRRRLAPYWTGITLWITLLGIAWPLVASAQAHGRPARQMSQSGHSSIRPVIAGRVLIETRDPTLAGTESTGDDSIDAVLRVHGPINVRMLNDRVLAKEPAAGGSSSGFLRQEIIQAWRLDRMLVIDLDPHTNLADLCVLLESLSSVEWACPDFVGHGGGGEANDSHYDVQWHHRNLTQVGGAWDADVDSDLAWRLSTGDTSVVVAVLDTGIDSDHPEFAGRLLPGHDFVNADADPEDDNGHGTRVSGVLAAQGDNNFGVAGMDWHCRILPVKVLDQNNLGETSVLIEGLLWAVNQGAHVINMSLIDYTDVEPLDAALHAARDAGVILVACAGNGGLGDADVSWPGASEATISVGATNPSDRRSIISGTGAALDVMAPGVSVATVLYNSDADDYDIFNGCSAATPIVSGIASLIKAQQPEVDHDAVREILVSSARDQIGAPTQDLPGRDDFYGYGRVDAAIALMRATSGLLPLQVGRDGTQAVIPMLTASATPRVGSSNLVLAIEEGLGMARALLFAGLDRLTTPAQGSAFLVGNPLLVLDLTLAGDPGQPAAGWAELGPFAIPDDPTLVGMKAVLQGLISDPAAEGGVAMTNALELTLQDAGSDH